jgi:hypothetical protein
MTYLTALAEAQTILLALGKEKFKGNRRLLYTLDIIVLIPNLKVLEVQR